MKLSTRGFTLVELMIVIAIIGILAAALFPSLTSYLARGRDTSRIAAIKDISTAILNYNTDNNRYPAVTAGTAGAVIASGSIATYLPKYPMDPTKAIHCTGCTPGFYGYGTGTISGSSAFSLSAIMENPNGGNTGAIMAYQGDNKDLSGIDVLKKGDGVGYVQRY